MTECSETKEVICDKDASVIHGLKKITLLSRLGSCVTLNDTWKQVTQVIFFRSIAQHSIYSVDLFSVQLSAADGRSVP